MADALATVGVPKFCGQRRLFLQHLQSLYAVRPAAAAAAGHAFFTPRNEVTLGVSSNWGKYRFSGWARRNLPTNQMVAVGADAAYEDECYIFDIRFYPTLYVLSMAINGSTTLLFQMTFKTVGQFGFKAL